MKKKPAWKAMIKRNLVQPLPFQIDLLDRLLIAADVRPHS